MTRDIWKHLILLIGAIIVLAPFYMMLSYSFKSPGEIDRGVGGFFGAQEMMVDPRCVKLRDPNRGEIAAAASQYPGKSDSEIRDAIMAQAKVDCSMRPVVFNYTKAFIEAFNIIKSEGWVAFNIKDTFLDEADKTGFSRMIRELIFSEYLDIYHIERYRHRYSIEGEPLYYFALAGRKNADVPGEFLSSKNIW